MASHSPAKCCLVGFKHDGDPQGEIKAVGGCAHVFTMNDFDDELKIVRQRLCRNTKGQDRKSHSASPRLHGLRISQYKIVSVTSIWPKNLLTAVFRVADQFAANGFITVVPDIWEGDNVPLNFENGGDFNLGGWIKRHPPSKVEPICKAAIKALKEEYGVKKLGAAGFCLGAKYVCRLMADGQGINAGYIAHPSAVTGDEVKGVAGPLMIAAAGR